MKTVISADGPDLNAEVRHKFSTSQYSTIIDLDCADFEAVPNHGASGQRGAIMQATIAA